MKYLFTLMMISVFLHAEGNYTNALMKEDSPYLKQHIHNPVNWYPWGEEALNLAKKENKLIFLSIGYSTCHWCHVMEEESFTDVEVAKLLNDDFISIKVDREEYPQIDKKYQQLYMGLYGKRGGWPLSIFLSPDAELFHLATYIPKEEGYGSKGLMDLLPSFVKLQKESAGFQNRIAEHQIKERNKKLKANPSLQIMQHAVNEISKEFDEKNGGFAQRPKFPEASKIELLLDIYRLNGDNKALEMAEVTLQKMAEGGIYDQIGGGFFRYTTDYAWQIPHFEKMLYTNGELVTVYVKAYSMTGKPLYKKTVDESIAQMEENFMEEGVYLSASDADSDGEEGGYFIYEYVEVKKALLSQGLSLVDVKEALAYLGIEENGNIDGDFSHTHITQTAKPSKLDEVKAYLKSVSSKRTFPFVDNKVITAWNAMMIKALFSASRVDKKYLKLAQKRLDALLMLMRKKDTLYHQVLIGKTPKQKALLEDYAFLIDALLAGYDRTYDKKYLSLLKTLVKESLENFYRNKQWYLSNDGLETKADFDDRYYTASLSVMLENLVRVASLTSNISYNEIVRETIKNHGLVLEQNPAFASKLVHTFVRLEKEDVIIHASKEKLLLAQTALDKVAYPFVLSAVQESDEYLACKTTMCFANDKNITKLIAKINKALE